MKAVEARVDRKSRKNAGNHSFGKQIAIMGSGKTIWETLANFQ
jgi:hypothetical protein